MTDAPAPPSRRSSATVRSLVLQAARELFDERGYEHVGTREIAVRAGVTQALVFRHFGTKANLFTEAIFQPFYDFVAGYLRRWAEQGHGSSSSVRDTEVFVSGPYRLLLDNRKLLVALTGQASGFAFALVYGIAVPDEVLFPPGEPRPEHASIASQMAGYVLRGSIMRDPGPLPGDPK